MRTLLTSLSVFLLSGCHSELPFSDPHAILQVKSPQGLSVVVGQMLPLEAIVSRGAVSWRIDSASKGSGTIDQAGRLSATKPGPITVIAEAGGKQATVIVAAVEATSPARLIRFSPSEFFRPSSSDGTTIINSREDLQAFWNKRLRFGEVVPAIPEVDFVAHSILAIVMGHAWYEPVITHLERQPTPIFYLAFPDIHNPGEVRPGGSFLDVYLFETVKVSGDARVSAYGPELFPQLPLIEGS